MSRDTCIMSVRVSDVSKLLIYIMVIGPSGVQFSL